MPKQQLNSQPNSRFLRWAILGCIAFLMVHILALALLAPTLSTVMLMLEGVVVLSFTRILLREPERYLMPLLGFSGKWGLLKGALLVLPLALVLVGVMDAPAHAAFYSAAETFFTSSFPEAGTAVPLIFNALRGIFLIYVGVALIGVLNAFRQGEEWISVARTPAAAIVVVALGDVLTTVIIN